LLFSLTLLIKAAAIFLRLVATLLLSIALLFRDATLFFCLTLLIKAAAIFLGFVATLLLSIGCCSATRRCSSA